MAKNREILFTVKVQTDGAEQEIQKVAKSTKDYEEAIGQLQDKLKSADLGSAQYKQLKKDLKAAEDQFVSVKAKNQSFTQSLSEIPGPLGNVGKGVQGLNTAFKALIANPIGAVITAIVLALTALYKAFTSTKAGAEKVEQIMAGLSAVIDVLRDRVLKIGDAFMKLFSGDFQGAAEAAKGAFTGIGDEIAKEFKAAADATATLQRVEDSMRTLNVERAKQNALIEEAKGKVNDENLSYEERLKALNDVREAEVKLAKQEQQLAEERYKALKALADLSDSSKEQLDELAEAEAQMYAKRQETAAKQKELADQEKSLRDKQRAEEQARAKEREAEAKRRLEQEKKVLEMIRQAEEENTLASIANEEDRAEKAAQFALERRQREIDALEATEEQKNKLREEAEEKYSLALDEIEAKRAEKKKAQDEKDEAERQAQIDKDLKDAQDLANLKNQIADAQAVTEEERQARELEKIQAYYDELIAKAQAAGLDTTALEEAKTAKLAETNDKFREAELAKEQSFRQAQRELAGTAVKDTLNLISEAFTVFGKKDEAAKKRAFNINKAAGIATATIDTFLAATGVLAATAKNPLTIAFPAFPMVQAGIIIASGLMQVAKIAAQKYEPGSAGGGGGGDAGGGAPAPVASKFAQGGLLRGRSHAEGGIMTPFGEMEGGEFVVNRAATQSFLPMLEQINSMGKGPQPAMGNVSGVAESMSMATQTPPIIKTYVVASDVTNQQEADKKISDIARL